MKTLLTLLTLTLALAGSAPAQTAREIDFQATSLTWSNHSANLQTNVTTTTAPAREFYGGETGGTLWLRGRSDYGAASVTVRWQTSPDNVIWATNAALRTTFYVTTNSDGSFTATSTWTEDTLGAPQFVRPYSYAIDVTNTPVTVSNLWFRTVLRK